MNKDIVVRWGGTAWLLPGLGAFLGRVGRHDWHHHLAHQIAIGVGAPARVDGESGTVTSRAVLIPAGVRHRLAESDSILSLYLDPLVDEARALGLRAAGPIRPLDLDEPAPLLASLAGSAASARDVRACLRACLGLSEPPPPDPRLARVMAALVGAAAAGGPDRATLAAQAALSPDRFSHWFAEQTGLALRSYSKWLRLLAALEHVAAGERLTEAAHAAGFSDSAHLSRTFRALFGLDPSSALAEVRLRT
ncbi:MAG: helix-turn-helix domain-containing protein [Gammaproteobacteria bacterium]|nr:helix-turn-helix domain-containing protein [Gammaproteobacteria bacterium]